MVLYPGLFTARPSWIAWASKIRARRFFRKSGQVTFMARSWPITFVCGKISEVLSNCSSSSEHVQRNCSEKWWIKLSKRLNQILMHNSVLLILLWLLQKKKIGKRWGQDEENELMKNVQFLGNTLKNTYKKKKKQRLIYLEEQVCTQTQAGIAVWGVTLLPFWKNARTAMELIPWFLYQPNGEVEASSSHVTQLLLSPVQLHASWGSSPPTG